MKPPHPATVVQRRPSPQPEARPPHPATVGGAPRVTPAVQRAKAPMKERKIKDRSGNVVKDEPLSAKEKEILAEIKKGLLKKENAKHKEMLEHVEGHVQTIFGPVGLQQLYRGAHFVFADRGQLYGSLISQFYELLMARYTDKDPRSSHYTSGSGFDTSIEKKYPQMGVDFPYPLTGHILFGIVPPKDKVRNGDTFLQSEMYGFQTTYNKYGGHGFGWFKSATGGGNSGLVGYSPHSEKQALEIREVDNK